MPVLLTLVDLVIKADQKNKAPGEEPYQVPDCKVIEVLNLFQFFCFPGR